MTTIYILPYWGDGVSVPFTVLFLFEDGKEQDGSEEDMSWEAGER